MIKQRTIERFIQGYIECMLWSSVVTDFLGDETSLEHYDIEDIDDATMAQIRRECVGFLRNVAQRNGRKLKKLWSDPDLGYSIENAGHDFWLSRNGHGAGFFDNTGPYFKKLQANARSWGEVELYLTDENRIRQYWPNIDDA